MKAKFRFMDLEIWKESISLNDKMYDLADMIDTKRKYRTAEQLRGASLSISNNIAEGSGSFSNKDFAHFLNMARRSVFEVVNVLVVSHQRKFINQDQLDQFIEELDVLSRKITNFRKSILNSKT
ncbi:MAG: four helix bundle protein [Cyclobacteriaceae bacterium]